MDERLIAYLASLMTVRIGLSRSKFLKVKIVASLKKIQRAEEFFVVLSIQSLCLKAISSQYTNETEVGIMVTAVFIIFIES